MFYAATVASTSGAPTNVAMVSGPTPQARTFTAAAALPKLQLRSAPSRKTGGSLTGAYEIDREKPSAPLASRLIASARGEVGLVVTTSRYPNGELYGALVPVR